MEMLDTEEEDISHIVSWLPHGRGFTIHDKKRFAAEVLPRHFKVAKFTSFTRRMNRWQFTLQKAAGRQSNYFHPQFIRGDLESCLKMRPRPQVYQMTTKRPIRARTRTTPKEVTNTSIDARASIEEMEMNAKNVNVNADAMLTVTPDTRSNPTYQNTVPLPDFMRSDKNLPVDDKIKETPPFQMQTIPIVSSIVPNTLSNCNPVILQTIPFPMTQYHQPLQTVFIPTNGLPNYNMNFAQNITLATVPYGQIEQISNIPGMVAVSQGQDTAQNTDELSPAQFASL